jgi:hypothetical protein
MGLGVAIGATATEADDELASASTVEVYERLGEPATFRLRYPLDVIEGDFPWLLDDRLQPGAEICIVAPTADESMCLIRGVVHAQQVHFQHGGAGSWVEVQGSDRLVMMDRESRSVVFDGTASSAVTTILGAYGFMGDVASTTTSFSDATHQLVQRDSDYRFVRRLARQHGFALWLTTDATGIETAHFKPLPVDESPAAELAINFSPPSLGSLDLSWDVERPTSVEAKQLDLGALSDIDGAATPALAALGSDDLTSITGDTRSVLLAAPADDADGLAKRGEGALVDASLFVRATAKTSVSQLGAVVRAHSLATMTGLGSRHSGTYLVSSVKHSIDATAHRMEIELLRNAWGAS